MYCRKCGAEIKETSKFCDSCGCEVVKVKQVSYAEKYNENKKKNKKIYDTVMTLGIIQWISPIEESNDPYYLSIRQGVEEYCFKNKIAIKRVFKTDVDYLNQLEDIQGLVCIGKYSQEDIETYKKILQLWH